MSIHDTAMSFFDACESGKGWQVCSAYCHADAGFSAQADALADVTTLAAYCDWMSGLLVPMPDGHYEIKSQSVDEERQVVTVFGVFHGTHSGEGPVPPTGKTVASDYVYAMQFDGGKIKHMTKIWNDGYALKQLGWA